MAQNDEILTALRLLYGTAGAMYTPGAVANWLIAKAKETNTPLDHMQLQKLIYFAHGKYLAKYGRALVNEPAEAWQFGPVFPSVYHEYKKFGAGTIPLGINGMMRELGVSGENPSELVFTVNTISHEDVQTNTMLEDVWQIYSQKTGKELSDMTHKKHKDNPWLISRKVMTDAQLQKIDIPNMLIAQYFNQLATSGESY
jgi:uncharacterized phage-associated protein